MKSIHAGLLLSSLFLCSATVACGSGPTAGASTNEESDASTAEGLDGGGKQDPAKTDASPTTTSLCPAVRCTAAPCTSAAVETFSTGVRSIAASSRELLVLVAETYPNAEVRKLPLAGGPSTTVRTGWMNYIAADDTTLYWTRRTQGQGSNTDVIESARLAAPSTVVGIASTENGLSSLLVTPQRLFWGATTSTGGGSELTSGTIRSIALGSSSPPQTMATGFRLALGLTTIGEDLFFGDWTANGSVLRVNAAGGTPTAIATRVDYPEAVTALGDRIYYVAGGQLFSVPKAGGTPVVLAPASGGLFAAGDAVYFGVSKALHCIRP